MSRDLTSDPEVPSGVVNGHEAIVATDEQTLRSLQRLAAHQHLGFLGRRDSAVGLRLGGFRGGCRRVVEGGFSATWVELASSPTKRTIRRDVMATIGMR